MSLYDHSGPIISLLLKAGQHTVMPQRSDLFKLVSPTWKWDHCFLPTFTIMSFQTISMPPCLHGPEEYSSTLMAIIERVLDCCIVSDKVMHTWNESAIIAVQVGVSLWCVENGGVTVARDLLQANKKKGKNTFKLDSIK